MKFITRAVNVILGRDIGPAMSITQDPQPHSLIFTLTDSTTGQSVTLDEDMMIFIMGQVREEIRMYSRYNSID